MKSLPQIPADGRTVEEVEEEYFRRELIMGRLDGSAPGWRDASGQEVAKKYTHILKS